MEISNRFEAKEIEEKWYSYWMEKGYFKSTPNEREPYCIVIPPPNVTGVLHMGHMLDNTIQDVLIRKARQDGKNACWVPGTDHASIATEAKVVKMLREQGIKKSDLTRDEYLEHAWQWKEKYGGIILDQLKKLGASCDWDRTAFTMDEERTKSVNKVFVDLYKKGKLYRGLRMVNWDPTAQTVLSNEEVLHKEETTQLYYIKYEIEGSEGEYVTIATTRPETIMGDSAIAVNPNDPRHSHLKGKRAIVPLVNRSVPIIMDDYVELDFGTGALKVTPAHDVNDYEIGKRHDLEVIDVLNPDGTLSEAAQYQVGVDRHEARKAVVIKLKETDQVEKIESLTHNVGRSERTDSVVEPRLSLQWYVDMKSLAAPALEAVEKDEVSFFPKAQKNLYRHWMENIRDWCISRQLWWGQRIPAWYYGEEVFVAETPEAALEQAREKLGIPGLTIDQLQQDEDVLDTWFSSWLWPMSVFEGFSSQEEIDYYYPTSVLVTGWDIIFQWVARMIMAGYEWKGERPFKDVYFHGMVRDGQRRKMSKSLGNSPDALQLLENFGADGVRFGMLMSSPVGGDLLFDEKLCGQGRNFCNKMWNALKLIDGWETTDAGASEADKTANAWITNRLNQVILENEKNYKEYRLSDIVTSLYTFIWTDFCSWYLEMIKPPYGKPVSAEVKESAKAVFTSICTILHPIMPFITEEMWHLLGNQDEDCILSRTPVIDAYDAELIGKIKMAQDIVSKVRDVRNKQNIKKSEPVPLAAEKGGEVNQMVDYPGMKALIIKMGVLSEFTIEDKVSGGVPFISGRDNLSVMIENQKDTEEEKAEIEQEIKYQEGFVAGIQKKLSNERFVNNAPAAVVDKERKKLADGLERVAILKQRLERI